MNRPMTSTVDELGARGFAARPDNQAIFMRAKRHSRLVRLLRLLVPVGTAVVLAGVTLMSWLDPMRILARLPTAQGQLVISGTKITMEAAEARRLHQGWPRLRAQRPRRRAGHHQARYRRTARHPRQDRGAGQDADQPDCGGWPLRSQIGNSQAGEGRHADDAELSRSISRKPSSTPRRTTWCRTSRCR